MKRQNGSRRLGWRLFLPLGILAAGIGIAVILMETRPQAQRRPRERLARLVEVQPIRHAIEPIVISAMGTVVPAQEAVIRPQVSGEIVEIGEEFVPGGRFRAGQMLVQIEPVDYELAVRQRKSDVAKSASAYQLEQAQQSVALREFELLDEPISETDLDLVLRKPQLASAQAAYEAAQATLEGARLDLKRTKVAAPFNGALTARNVNVGTQVSPSTALGTLVGTDEYWVEVSVPVDQLQWLYIPRDADGKGSFVRVFNEAAWGVDAFREGRVIRLAPDLEKEGRMARLLVSIEDPLATGGDSAGSPPLLLGTYVRVEMTGKRLDDARVISRIALRDGDRAWIMNDSDQLEIRDVRILFRGRESVLVDKGVRAGERLVLTDLGAPVAGMPLRVQENASEEERP